MLSQNLWVILGFPHLLHIYQCVTSSGVRSRVLLRFFPRGTWEESGTSFSTCVSKKLPHTRPCTRFLFQVLQAGLISPEMDIWAYDSGSTEPTFAQNRQHVEVSIQYKVPSFRQSSSINSFSSLFFTCVSYLASRKASWSSVQVSTILTWCQYEISK